MSTIRARILQDMDAPNPRKEFDNFGVMVCWHNRYDLGDETRRDDVQDFMRELATEVDASVERRIDYWENGRGYEAICARFHEWRYASAEIERQVARIIEAAIEKHVVMLSLYLYDHGGITMNTGGFSCPWDSGQVGYIYATREMIQQEYGKQPLTRTLRARVEDLLRGEVKCYDQYLRGDVWGVVIEEYDEASDPDAHYATEIDACWGFFGSDPRKNGMMEQVEAQYRDLLLEAYFAM